MVTSTFPVAVLRIAAGLLGLGTLMRPFARSVVTGFSKAPAILICLAQVPALAGVPWRI